MKDVPMVKGGLVGGTGYTGLFYKGFPIVSDEKATAQNLIFINEDFVEWRSAPFFGAKPINYKNQIEGNDYSPVKGLGFMWTGFVEPTDQHAITGHVVLSGNLITSNPKRHGKLTGITGV